ncbi:uncharacterized protein UV8b_01376 [Ustilaginoidea virens]|uniref:NGG1 interacting factor Nif3 n=1 Tax=Ustilaginoidea virens TaxID=1159556 RepID=A0A8E5HKI5_USTVR|nr:uncharacterized protein UV8b_01376 [Ustilaginoidea virens]QUC17135.1 hypothetical protein UV8b_01376 [Ustilaginoidea virens]
MSEQGGRWGAWQVQPSGFTQLVVKAMQKLYPEELADRSWDNVGLLVGNSKADGRKPKVLVTNDLTWQVAEDAIAQQASVIVSYHPFIFSGLKSITNDDAQQATLLRLAQANIAVYCPHTAVDAAPGGLNTWLADIVSGPHASKRSVAVPCTNAPESHSPAGYGALGWFETPVALPDILRRLARGLGGLKHLMVASPFGADVRSTMIRSFGVCAGSGYDVLKKADVDLLVTGETSHHSALRAIQQGRTLVQVFHSNSERGYLQNILRHRLELELRAEVPDAEVVSSLYDRDPFTILGLGDLDL